jgi:signal transduction histidine kinase/ActR/RegA family two-component response regulator
LRLARPIAELSATMERAERGDTGARAVADGPHELRAMAHAFNRMLDALHEREHELARHRDHLEELVAERTRQLSEEKVRAEVASHAKSEFLARMSHELRTPLNAVLGYAQLLKMDGTLDARQAAGVETIRTSGEHLLALIVDILDLARIEAGKSELTPAPLALTPFLRGIADIVRVRADEKRLGFTLEVAPTLPPAVLADEKRLRQVLLNLLGNAVKFTERGSVTLAVQASPQPGARVRLRFEVRDTGMGIAPEHLERIFEPFEQAGDAHRRFGGTGLGLAISRQLVRLMGGEIDVHSEPGRGSVFGFAIDVPTVACADAPQTTPLPAGYDGARRRVLVVDDVPGNRAMLVALLAPLGFEVLQAADGAQALDAVRMQAPDLVLLDIQMPVLDGLEVLRRLRAQPAWQTLPVVAVSANVSADEKERCLHAGADAFVAKPIDHRALIALIGQALSLRWHEGTPAA